MIMSFLEMPKSKLETSRMISDGMQVALNYQKIVKFPGWAACFQPDWMIDSIVQTGLVKIDVRHIDEKTFKLQKKIFWEITYDPSSSKTYAHSKERQPLHTDNSWFSDPAELSFFIMDTRSPAGGESTYYTLHQIIEDLEKSDKALLHKLSTVEVTIQKTKEEQGNRTRIIDLEKGLINWNFYRVEKSNDTITEMCNDFFQFLERQEKAGCVPCHLFDTGDCYIVPDQKMLHGRKDFIATKKGDRRLLHSQWKLI
jgi:alpha-ketoglutarate-dependent taurine dioxygenase